MANYVDTSAAWDEGALQDWYMNSIDDTIPPIWTEEHISELRNDFFVIPKEAPAADVRPERHGEWVHLGGDEWGCSCCGYVIYTEGNWEHPMSETRCNNFCCKCGAKMKAPEAET